MPTTAPTMRRTGKSGWPTWWLIGLPAARPRSRPNELAFPPAAGTARLHGTISQTYAAYLSSLADSGRKASTIGRRAAAIGYHHKMADHEPPTGSEAVKAVLRGIRRTIGSAKQGKAPATADLIGQMAISPKSPTGYGS